MLGTNSIDRLCPLLEINIEHLHMITKWHKICNNIQKKLSPGTFKVWIMPLIPSEKDGKFLLTAPSEFVANWVQERLLKTISDSVFEVLGKNIAIHIQFKQVPEYDESIATTSNSCAVNEKTSTQKEAVSIEQLFLPMYTKGRKNKHTWQYNFESFIVGSCNHLAHAAAKSMTADVSSVATLFLSSGPGLGKTHLTQAVGLELYSICNKDLPKIEYLTAEEFCSCFVQAIRSKNVDQFKGRFRDIDLLLLEDIHFLQDKEKMQDEVLATIQSLQKKGSKVILTSSFAPKELRNVDSRLVSMFCSGFLAGIGRPDKDLRQKILVEKAKIHSAHLEESIADLLASKLVGDVRQLESCIHNLVLKSKVMGCSISLDMAMETLTQYDQNDPFMSVDSIEKAVCRCFGLPPEKLCSRSRKKDYVIARNTVFYLLRVHTDMSLQDIGDRFNRRHSTVLKGIATVEREIQRKTTTGRQIANTLTLLEKNSPRGN